MPKKSLTIAAAGIIVILALVSVALWFAQELKQREAINNVQIALDGVSVESIGLTGATLNIRLRVYNPGTITATLDHADYDMYGNNVHLGNGTISQRVDIPPGGTRAASTDFYLSYAGVGNVLWNAIREGKVTWRVRGTAYFDALLGTINIPFDLTL